MEGSESLVCESCGRFDKYGRLDKAVKRLFNQFLLENQGSGEFQVKIDGKRCSVYAESQLRRLVEDSESGIRLRIFYDEDFNGAYVLADYCREE